MGDRYLFRRGVLDPAAGDNHAWGSLNIVSDRVSTGVDGVTVGMARIPAGSENPLHVHRNCTEIVLLLSGSVMHVVGDDVVALSAGDVLVVPRGMQHRASNSGAGPAEMVVVYDSGDRGFEVVE